MSTNHSNNRRDFLKNILTGAGLALVASPAAKAFANSCGITPPQTMGPFYPTQSFSLDHDLTRIQGRSDRAKGTVVLIEGIVRNAACTPIKKATVEIWQASASGKYNHPSDSNPAAIDPNFRHWAEVVTDQDGKYSFRTIIPGAYPADQNWTRPPHIHFKISALGYHELVTQMYFSGNSLNQLDPILQALSKEEQKSVTVLLGAPNPADPDRAASGTFDVTLKKVST